MNKKKKIVSLLLFVCSIFVSLFTIGLTSASITSDSVQYTNVLDDLQKDNNFDSSNYIVDTTDNSLKVIQVGESDYNELFLYVYQPNSPNDKLRATYINMSLTANNDNNKIYQLTLLNSNGVFHKYRVKNFSVSNEKTRYYNITSIYRKWLKGVDDDTSEINDNVISQVSFEVGYLYTLRTNNNGEIEFNSSKLEVINITSKWVGYIRYGNGSGILPANTDAFFVAFDTDRKIDELLQADISFVHYSYHKEIDLTTLDGETTWTNGEHITENKTLSATKTEEIKVGYIFKSKYSWQQIMSKNDFVEDNQHTLTKIAGENLENTSWVLNFWTAKYSEYSDSVLATPVRKHEKGERVTNVTILRLTFNTNGMIYNLGCVDNMQNSSSTPAGYGVSLLDKLRAYIQAIFGLIMIILFVILLSPILPTIISMIWFILKCFIKIILWLLLLPVRIVKRIVSKGKE